MTCGRGNVNLALEYRELIGRRLRLGEDSVTGPIRTLNFGGIRRTYIKAAFHSRRCSRTSCGNPSADTRAHQAKKPSPLSRLPQFSLNSAIYWRLRQVAGRTPSPGKAGVETRKAGANRPKRSNRRRRLWSMAMPRSLPYFTKLLVFSTGRATTAPVSTAASPAFPGSVGGLFRCRSDRSEAT